MKTQSRLFPFFMVIFAVLVIGCSSSNKSDIRKVVTAELDLLKNLDSETAQKYISYPELFSDTAGTQEALSEEIKDAFSLFFKNFDYKIKNVTVDDKKGTASVTVSLTTPDGSALARDYAAARLKSELQQSSGDSDLTLEDRILLLNHLLKTNEYETIETTAEITLSKKDDGSWEIDRTHELENSLVGGLITALSDPDILSPDETMDVYLKTIKQMNLEELQTFFGTDALSSEEDPAGKAISEALVQQIHQFFDYEIKGSTVDDYHAQVQTEITSFDSDAILEAYRADFSEYLATPEAVLDGYDKRYELSYETLTKYIKANDKTTKSDSTFHLVNDGVSWTLQDPENELGKAILGALSGTAEEDLALEEDDYSEEETSTEDLSGEE